MSDKPISRQERLETNVSPMFSPDAGRRLRLIRMKFLWDQFQLGELLGMSQQQVSKLEQGHVKYVPFSLARFKAVFGPFYTFILFGTEFRDLNAQMIQEKYWDVRLRERRKKGSGENKRNPIPRDESDN